MYMYIPDFWLVETASRLSFVFIDLPCSSYFLTVEDAPHLTDKKDIALVINKFAKSFYLWRCGESLWTSKYNPQYNIQEASFWTKRMFCQFSQHCSLVCNRSQAIPSLSHGPPPSHCPPPITRWNLSHLSAGVSIIEMVLDAVGAIYQVGQA